MAGGKSIGDYSFRPSVLTITYTLAYEMEQARVYGGLSLSEWDRLPGTPAWVIDDGRSKSHMLVLYRMSNAIPAAANDAQAREQERQSKRRH